MSRFFQLRSFLTYWLNAVDEHSLHSPFLFDLYTKVIDKKDQHEEVAEKIRRELLGNNRTIHVNDLGSGSMHLSGTDRKIADIARTSLTPTRYSQLYRRLITYFRLHTIIELGTSFGINTLYLAQGNTSSVYTFEGVDSIAHIARHAFAKAEANNIQLISGNIDKTLPPLLERIRKVDLAFIDANHRYEPTLRYFNTLSQFIHPSGIIVIDDVHYSKGMQLAWEEIKKHKLVYASVDLYRCGMVFFDPSLNRQHVVLQF